MTRLLVSYGNALEACFGLPAGGRRGIRCTPPKRSFAGEFGCFPWELVLPRALGRRFGRKPIQGVFIEAELLRNDFPVGANQDVRRKYANGVGVLHSELAAQ